MIVLSLDTSVSRTGWCKGKAGESVETGSFRLPRAGSAIGPVLTQFEGWLSGMVEGVDLISFEKPVRPFQNANLDVMRKLYSLAGIVEKVAHEAGKDVCEVNGSTMKKMVYANGGMRSAEKKKQAVGLVRGWGIECANHDEADAVACYLVTLHYRAPEAFAVWSKRRDELVVSRMAGEGA